MVYTISLFAVCLTLLAGDVFFQGCSKIPGHHLLQLVVIMVGVEYQDEQHLKKEPANSHNPVKIKIGK